MSAQMLDEALKKSGGKYPGAVQFIKTMLALKVDAPRGPVTFDDVWLRQRRALEYGRQDLSRRQPILDLRKGNFSEAAGLQPRFPAL